MFSREFTLEITSYCPHACEYCSSEAGPDGKHLPYEEAVAFLDAQKVNGFDVISISGGEPLSHPRFWDILQLCRSKTNNVWVYTNALPRIRYNATVIPEVWREAYCCLVPGREIYIPARADAVRLVQLVSQGRARDMKPANIDVSGNLKGRDYCDLCDHTVLQADGQVADAPCRKRYGEVS